MQSLEPAAFAHPDLGRLPGIVLSYVDGTQWTPDAGTWTTLAVGADNTTWVEVRKAWTQRNLFLWIEGFEAG